MLFDVKKIFNAYDAPIKVEEKIDLSQENFPGYEVRDPVRAIFEAELNGKILDFKIFLEAQVDYECARCLEPSQQIFRVDRVYPIRETDLSDIDAELPFLPDGKLDTHELAYSELLLEVPTVLLCSDDCAGLCPICGRKKPCACTHETNDAVDERLSILKQLLS
ncbi:DUF177 domain-containing protein [uncultured Ruthenibacterium sp.]|uniref:YceD family protein n=1 Tax=uncultured Ruthenibacterium sp. TaxID=1905347 RepID=UPI00349E840A